MIEREILKSSLRLKKVIEKLKVQHEKELKEKQVAIQTLSDNYNRLDKELSNIQNKIVILIIYMRKHYPHASFVKELEKLKEKKK